MLLMLTKKVKANIIKETRIHETDTGSANVQVGVLSRRILELATHLKKNPKDIHSRRGLLKMVSKRRKLEKYSNITEQKKTTASRRNKKQEEVSEPKKTRKSTLSNGK